jgi:hypothetical protein
MGLRIEPPELVIDLWDEGRAEWRVFTVAPHDLGFVPKCDKGIGLHQFKPKAKICSCGGIRRD